jgi:hypothetical protein
MADPVPENRFKVLTSRGKGGRYSFRLCDHYTAKSGKFNGLQRRG